MHGRRKRQERLLAGDQMQAVSCDGACLMRWSRWDTRSSSVLCPTKNFRNLANKQMSEHSVIKMGQVFRVPYRGQEANRSGLASYQELTRGIHEKSADLQKGMFFYQHVPERGQKFTRIPAFIFHSNPFKGGGEGAPWVDVVEPDVGYCLFHGDNREPGAPPLSSRGNARFAQAQNLYADPALRKFAPPILVFKQVEFEGSNKGHRQFCGFGVPVRQSVSVQKTGRQDTSQIL